MTSQRCLSMVAIAFVCCLTAGAEPVAETFDDGAARWEPVGGDWQVEDGVYVQRDASSPDYRMSLFDAPWREGTLKMTATALERNDNGRVGASFGVVVKYIDEDNWCIARFGSYGSCNLLVNRPDGKDRINLGGFSPQIGQSYRAGVILREGLLAIVREGVVLAIFEDPFPDQSGRPGLFTETHCAFDDVRIEAIE